MSPEVRGEINSKPADTAVRLDKFLSDNFGVSRAYGAELVEKGRCCVNGVGVTKKSLVLSVGDNVVLDIPPPRPLEVVAEDIPLDVRYEDDDVIAVNKPRGMVVHPAAGHYDGTLVNALLCRYGGRLSGINGVSRPGILHRIDKNTSGLLLVARNDRAHNFLAAQIKAHSLKRRYEAVAEGVIRGSGTVYLPIGRGSADRKKMCVRYDNCKAAVTHYEVITNFARHTHLRLNLETGRTHQIRVHLAHMGHPVAGDDVYGSGKPLWLGGQCLHARTVGFLRPSDNAYVEVDAELPLYFEKMLDYCGKIR